MSEQEQVTPPASPDAAAAANPQIESRAREMGWVSKEEFRGDQSKWVDASAYVKRGEELLPIVRAENRRLHSELQNVRGQLSASTQATQELRQSVEDLKQFNSQTAKTQAKLTRSEVAKAIKQAREDGDVERELELQDELEAANRTIRNPAPAAPAAPARPAAPAPAQPTPEFQAWQQANPWFGAQGQERKTNYAIVVAQDLRATRPDLQGTQFFEAVNREVSAVFDPPQRRQSRVEGGNGSDRSSSGDSAPAGFSNLPAEAQSFARSKSRQFVGANKAFKTEAEWFNHFAATYKP